MKAALYTIIAIVIVGLGYGVFTQIQKNTQLQQQLTELKRTAMDSTEKDELEKLKVELIKQQKRIETLESQLDRKQQFIDQLEQSYDSLMNKKINNSDDMGSQFRAKNLPSVKSEVRYVVIKPKPRPEQDERNAEKAHMNVVNWNAPIEKPEEKIKHKPTSLPTLSQYEQAKARLSQECKGILNSREAVNCRKAAKESFRRECRNEGLPKYLRSANCSLARSYRVVD